MYQDVLNLIRLLDFDADAHTVYTGLDKYPFILIARNCERIQKDFGRGLRFDFGNVMSLRGLGCEVRKA